MTKRNKTTRKTPTRRRGAKKRSRRRGRWGIWLVAVTLIGLTIYTAFLDYRIRSRFEGRRWALPARVLARPLEIHADKALTPEALIRELKLLRYRKRVSVGAPGDYRRKTNTVLVHTRGFPFSDDHEPARKVRITFRNKRVKSIKEVNSGTDLGLMRLEPVPIANIYPNHNEDRMLVRLADVPPTLLTALIAVEDRRFYEHHGIDFIALGRALLANLKAGRTVQGGSTLTQQLVKNYFLTNERTLWRKFTEAIMAVLLEWHYSKDEILQAYLNEVYLGQEGRRAIHGFALASQFYFAKRLNDLSNDRLALLVALIRGPSYYEPRRHPERAKARRDLVVGMLEGQGHMNATQAARARNRPLGVTDKAPSGATPFPGFVQLVRRQLQAYYRDEDLRSEGLVIFTTLDPLIQLATEQALEKRLGQLERQRGLAQGALQSAVIVSDVENGEILALVGGRDVRFAGYNRALDARRPVGSLIKPVIYLTALAQSDHYTFTTPLDDSPLRVELANGQVWAPQNDDQTYHGQVMLRDALVHSYNVPTAKLGLDLGVDEVAENLRRLSLLQRSVVPYPSLLLGAVDLSPLEVSQLYQTFAAGGYRVPLSAIRAVMDRQAQRLQRYPLRVRQVADASAVYLLNGALHEVTRQGTAKRLAKALPETLRVAGKTGTTDGLRDSWFAGFSGEHLAVVWIGRDDNRSTGLSGATGALPVWADIMRGVSTRSLHINQPENVEWQLVDGSSGLLADDACAGAQWMPFIKGTGPEGWAPCAKRLGTTFKRTFKWFKGLLH